ncbi:MAG: DUF4160 domain-containing protein [Defluviitaleaceae bacterium]|nr:DUF4160 domain-containing protein [Defluviitaleaceae bacterium]
MPKIFKNKVAGYFLYFDSSCLEEPAHLHTSESPKLIYAGNAKIWVFPDGNTKIQYAGDVPEKSLRLIQDYLSNHYLEFFELWSKKKTPFEILGFDDRTFTLADIEEIQRQQQVMLDQLEK